MLCFHGNIGCMASTLKPSARLIYTYQEEYHRSGRRKTMRHCANGVTANWFAFLCCVLRGKKNPEDFFLTLPDQVTGKNDAYENGLLLMVVELLIVWDLHPWPTNSGSRPSGNDQARHRTPRPWQAHQVQRPFKDIMAVPWKPSAQRASLLADTPRAMERTKKKSVGEVQDHLNSKRNKFPCSMALLDCSAQAQEIEDQARKEERHGGRKRLIEGLKQE